MIFVFFCLRESQRHPRVQLATLEQPNQHALAATALEWQLCRCLILVTRRNNWSKRRIVCGVEIGCWLLDRYTQGIRYQWIDFDVFCPFWTVKSFTKLPYVIVSQKDSQFYHCMLWSKYTETLRLGIRPQKLLFVQFRVLG